jgi:hypothetical protein
MSRATWQRSIQQFRNTWYCGSYTHFHTLKIFLQYLSEVILINKISLEIFGFYIDHEIIYDNTVNFRRFRT